MDRHSLLKTLVFASVVCVPLQADAGSASFGSIEPSDLVLEYTAGNGEPVTVPIARASGTVSSQKIDVKDGGSTELTVRSPDGEVLARGRVNDQGWYFLHRNGSKYVLAQAGATIASWTQYPGTVIVNTLAENLKVDLFPEGGDTPFKNVKVTRQFDLKHAAVLPPKWTSYTAIIHRADGSTLRQQGIGLGWYHVIHTDQNTGEPILSPLGQILGADKKKRK